MIPYWADEDEDEENEEAAAEDRMKQSAVSFMRMERDSVVKDIIWRCDKSNSSIINNNVLRS